MKFRIVYKLYCAGTGMTAEAANRPPIVEAHRIENVLAEISQMMPDPNVMGVEVVGVRIEALEEEYKK